MVLKFYIIFSSILLSSNEKTQNYKVVDLIEVYNLHIKIIFIQHRIEGFSIFWNLSLITRETILSRETLPAGYPDSTIKWATLLPILLLGKR